MAQFMWKNVPGGFPVPQCIVASRQHQEGLERVQQTRFAIDAALDAIQTYKHNPHSLEAKVTKLEEEEVTTAVPVPKCIGAASQRQEELERAQQTRFAMNAALEAIQTYALNPQSLEAKATEVEEMEEGDNRIKTPTCASGAATCTSEIVTDRCKVFTI